MEEECYFSYSEKETDYLKGRDGALGQVIDRIGHVKRAVIPDLFTALVHSITGQQVSTKAHSTLWARMQDVIGDITPENIIGTPDEMIRGTGISSRKVAYIKNAAFKVRDGAIDLQNLHGLPEQEVADILCSLDGIGRWSAEMLMLFSMQRPDILSYGDLAIRRGLCIVHGLGSIDRNIFEKYRRLYSPCGSVASLYLWAVAGESTDMARHE